MTKKNVSPTTFVFHGEEKPVISSKAFSQAYPGVRQNSHGNLLVKVRAAMLCLPADFLAGNVQLVYSTGPAGKLREVLMTEEGARAILAKIRSRAPKAMTDFVEAAIDIVDERFKPGGLSVEPAPCVENPSVDEVLARNVALTARAARLECEADDLREKVADQERWLDEAESEKAALRQRIAELEGAIDHIEEKSEPDQVEMVRALSAHFTACHVPEGPAAILAASLVLGNNYGPEMIRELRPYL